MHGLLAGALQRPRRLVLNGHQHCYERFGLQNASGQADANGVRQFVVGTGGESYTSPSTTRAADSQAIFSGQNAFGVLKMTLHSGSYDWNFVPVTGTFSDSGSQACHNGGGGGGTTDTTPPTTTPTCNAAACSTGWYRTAPVGVQLSATDSGSAVAATYYATDGTTPTTQSPLYSTALSLPETTTVRYFSVDTVGNSETPRTTSVRVDAAAPNLAVTAPTDGTTLSRRSSTTLTASATDLGTGAGAPSGVARVTFYLDGSQIAQDTTAPYSVSWKPKTNLRGVHTLTAVAADGAGNTTTSAPVRVNLG
ncbi:MAG: Ig-like domain-containing protein [Nocardioides sp.]